jgi:probable addiction module antidote protein
MRRSKKASEEEVAQEIYTALVESRRSTKGNYSTDLAALRSMNVTQVAAKIGLSRVSLYRMLSKGGNPRLQNLVSLFHVLGLGLWTVEKSFVRRRGVH